MLSGAVFRSYDIRAVAPELVDKDSVYFGQDLNKPGAFMTNLTPAEVEIIGRGLAKFFGEKKIAIGRDCRLSSPAWAEALCKGITSEGVDVVDLGLTTTDAVYFVAGAWNMPAVQITASHCTKEINGLKMVRAGVQVVGQGSGMEELAKIVLERDSEFSAPEPTARSPLTNRSAQIVRNDLAAGPHIGKITKRDPLPEYLDHLFSFVDPQEIKPFKLIADAGNGMAGVVAEELFKRLPQLEVEKIYFTPDGAYPNHVPNPFEVENIRELIAKVPKAGVDLAVAWDGDADRVYFLDETGRPIPGDFITTLIARYFLNKEPGGKIIYDLRSSWAVRDWVKKLGGAPIAEKVGHSFIKQTMRRERAIFGGEVSGHYYFRDNYFADNGFIPILVVLTMLSRSGEKLSELVKGLGDYHVSGEINSTVKERPEQIIHRLAERYAEAEEINYLDGITVNYRDWHFNVRPSANDPVVRLNLEARSAELLAAKREEVLSIIRQV